MEAVVRILNEALKADREAVCGLFTHRVPCNQELGGHPTIQVLQEGGVTTLGVLGLINSLFGTIPSGPRQGWGWICAVLDNRGVLARFELTTEREVIDALPVP